MIESNSKTKKQVMTMINSLIDIITKPSLVVKKSPYLYHQAAKNNFVIHMYIFKLLINDKEYLANKYEEYISKYPKKIYYNIANITNIEYIKEIDLLFKIKDKLTFDNYIVNYEEERIYFNDKTYVDYKWFLTFISMLLDNTKNDEFKEINICYTIARKDTNKVKDKKDCDKFLENFNYYRINIKHVNNKKAIKENDLLIVKNTAINYLKHLRQYKHGLESEESYLIFYNLLKKECSKDGFKLSEEEMNLLDIEYSDLEKIKNLMDSNFYSSSLSKQVHIIESAVWQLSNDITLLEHMNSSIDNLVDLLTIIRLESNKTYEMIKKEYNLDDAQILLVLAVNKYLLTYLDEDNVDYSLLDLSNIKPKYMNSICENNEALLKEHLKNLNLELQSVKRDLDKYKKERSNLNKKELDKDKYQKELEMCVSKINRASIVIGKLNSNISSVSKQYEEERKKIAHQYHNIDNYNNNISIIKHLYNSIMASSYYLKTNNTNVLNNIIVFEDYEKTENSFYLEITIKELLKISNQNLLNGIKDQSDLPKLA